MLFTGWEDKYDKYFSSTDRPKTVNNIYSSFYIIYFIT